MHHHRHGLHLFTFQSLPHILVNNLSVLNGAQQQSTSCPESHLQSITQWHPLFTSGIWTQLHYKLNGLH